MDTLDELKNYDAKQKILLLGKNNSGKTTFTNVAQSRCDDFYKNNSTIGIEYAVYFGITNNNKKIKVAMWDTCGDKRFVSIIRSYIKCTDAYLLVYDVNDIESFNDLDFWMGLIYSIGHYNDNQKSQHKSSIYLIGTKIDLFDKMNNNSVKKEHIDNFIKKYKLNEINSYQINATKFNDVNKVLQLIINDVYSKSLEKIKLPLLLNKNNKNNNKSDNYKNIIIEKYCCSIL